MSTLPRAKSPLTPPGISQLFLSFAQSRQAETDAQPRVKSSIEASPGVDFDAGINTSTAWTEHLDDVPPHSLSDEEVDDAPDEDADGRSARVLYKFEGKPEFREINAEAGDAIEVVREEVGDGWSLVKKDNGEMGLLPREYYTFTIEFISAPATGLTSSVGHASRREASNASLTPRASPSRKPQPLPDVSEEAPPIVVQTTGERMMAAFPSFRQSLLGGKSLNRFSHFVTSGAESYVLKGGPSTDANLVNAMPRHAQESSDEEDIDVSESEAAQPRSHRPSEADRHFVDEGPSWKAKVPPFRVLVHSPSKRASTLSGSYTVYSVTSLFHLPPDDDIDSDPSDPPLTPTRITVHRRFSHFVVLHTALTRRLPGLALPPLPEKQYAGRFNDDFVEARRGDLERYLTKVVRHPVARYAEILTFFLGCESETEWKRQLPRHLALPPAGPSFYANVFHPAFNLDTEDAAEVADRFDTHIRAVDVGVQGLRNVFGEIRQARVGMSKAERLLSYSLLSLITAKPLAAAPNSAFFVPEEPAYESDSDSVNSEDKVKEPKGRGVVNEDGAWCWREECEDCLRLTKALQKTSETLQSVADLYDDHARRRQLLTHDALKTVAHPSPLYAPIIDTHKNALSRYNEAAHGDKPDDEVAARCETVLNTTMAEMETYHAQKVEDFSAIAKDHLDGEIEFYEQVLTRLRGARRNFDPAAYAQLGNDPRQPSIPAPHVFDSTPMRPVSQAIHEGVGMLLGGATAGRGSVFGKFW
ncbi:hypothetical protein EVG20_g2061 [Dentipellis fragilis]|uniref:PX domain-containing protein n=1 Tax=Dentipellis fragilis TaxID=205917 RepID=A0A4Y9ZAR6_9AGAM|nr:hypothetical protein EVG20_g2061 [Dentipellis fragilis]